MIRVLEKLEPPDFDRRVRTPGNLFLRRKVNSKLRSKDWERHWRHCVEQLRDAYDRVCAYTSVYIPAGSGSVDHFIPKAKARDLAYEWSNYRFCTPRVNTNKGKSLRVMDPFHIQNGWFVIDFASYLVKPAAGLPDFLNESVKETIEDLRLNDDDNIAQERADKVQEYIDGLISFEFLSQKYPFIASELVRQNLVESIRQRTRKTPI